jgi:hypothetical protein
MIPTPIRLDRVQRGLFEVFSAALAPVGVAWGYNEASYETLPANLAILTMIAGPQPWNRSGKRGAPILPALSAIVQVTAATSGALYLIRLNGIDYRYEAAGGDTIGDIRDALVSAIVADTEATATAAPSGLDGVEITPTSGGGVRTVEIVGPLAPGAVILDSQAYLITEGTQTALVNLQTYSKGREIRNGAWGIAASALATMQTESFVETLRGWGVGLWSKGAPTDLTAITSGHWESRVSFDFTVSMRAEWVDPVDTIETVNAAIAVLNPDGSTAAQVNTTTTAP